MKSFIGATLAPDLQHAAKYGRKALQEGEEGWR